MKRMMMTAALTIAAVNFLIAQTPPTTPTTEPDSSTPTETIAFGMTLTEVPELLRMHLPMLPAGAGWVVQNVETGGPAAAIGVQSGDVLIELDGRPIGDLGLLDRATEHSMMMVVRRGIPKPLPIGRSAMNRHQLSDPIVGTSAMSFSFSPWASSTMSAGGEAVSVSRVDDKVMISISSSDPAIGNLKLSGTMDEIRRDLGGDAYSDAAKAAIRRAIGE